MAIVEFMVSDLTAAHVRLNRHDVTNWRRLRAQARIDLPILDELARSLEQLRAVTLASEQQDLEAQLGALNRYIEDARLRFRIG